MSAFLNGINTAALAQFADSVRKQPAAGQAAFEVRTRWDGQTRSVARVTSYRLGEQSHARDFTIAADEPAELLGTNSAPNPQELLMAALNACMTVGYAANAALLGVRLHALEIETVGTLDLRGFLGLDASVNPGYDEVRYTVRIEADGSAEQIEQIHQAVMRTSPNFANLARAIRMVPTLVFNKR